MCVDALLSRGGVLITISGDDFVATEPGRTVFFVGGKRGSLCTRFGFQITVAVSIAIDTVFITYYRQSVWQCSISRSRAGVLRAAPWPGISGLLLHAKTNHCNHRIDCSCHHLTCLTLSGGAGGTAERRRQKSIRSHAPCILSAPHHPFPDWYQHLPYTPGSVVITNALTAP